MTKVDELRELLKKGKEEPHEHSDAWAFVAELFRLLEDKWQGLLPDIVTMHVYAIQSSAREEGAAEERERIREGAVATRAINITAGIIEQPTENDTLYWDMAYIIPLSVFTSKEREP